MGIENGKFNAVFLNLATEYVQYIIRLILQATQTLDTCACHVLLYRLNCKKKERQSNEYNDLRDLFADYINYLLAA